VTSTSWSAGRYEAVAERIADIAPRSSTPPRGDGRCTMQR
jgi:hypothetical protein